MAKHIFVYENRAKENKDEESNTTKESNTTEESNTTKKRGQKMKLTERNGLRIVSPSYGYSLRNIKTNEVYSGKIYLGINSSIEDFEEIKNENIDETLLNAIQDIEDANNVLLDTIKEVEAKEQSLNKIGKIVANQVTDDAIALSIQEFYDEWETNVNYIVGQYITYNDILYKVLTNHTSQETWTPDVTGSLFAKVLVDPTGETVLDWVQPDSTNPYMKDDKVKYNEKIYVSTIDNNVWEPGVYGWELEGE